MSQCIDKFPLDFYDYLANNTLVAIKGGKEKYKFLEIWMVNVNGRIFARTWNKSKKSWFTSLLNEGIGEIKYASKIINIRAEKIDSGSTLIPLINSAYISKYQQPENIKYANGITKPEYNDYTVELTYVE